MDVFFCFVFAISQELVVALSHLVVQYESNFCTVALQFIEEEKNYAVPSPANAAGDLKLILFDDVQSLTHNLISFFHHKLIYCTIWYFLRIIPTMHVIVFTMSICHKIESWGLSVLCKPFPPFIHHRFLSELKDEMIRSKARDTVFCTGRCVVNSRIRLCGKPYPYVAY